MYRSLHQCFTSTFQLQCALLVARALSRFSARSHGPLPKTLSLSGGTVRTSQKAAGSSGYSPYVIYLFYLFAWFADACTVYIHVLEAKQKKERRFTGITHTDTTLMKGSLRSSEQVNVVCVQPCWSNDELVNWSSVSARMYQEFWNVPGKLCPFTIQILIKSTIFKMMALHDTLVCDSENWCTY